MYLVAGLPGQVFASLVSASRQLLDVGIRPYLAQFSPVPGTPLGQSERRRVLSFQEVLHARRVPCTVRVQRGVDIAAACGQLAGGAGGPRTA